MPDIIVEKQTQRILIPAGMLALYGAEHLDGILRGLAERHATEQGQKVLGGLGAITYTDDPVNAYTNVDVTYRTYRPV